MPTGYTAKVQDGTISSFEDFIWYCARGMGALISMRDSPVDAPIPERFEPDTRYYDGRLEEAKARLEELREMGPDAVKEAAERSYAELVENDEAYAARKEIQRERYESMLKNVRAWNPPTQDHVGFKDFMIEQLTESIKFDCAPHSFIGKPKKLEPSDWFLAEVMKATDSIAHNSSEREKEIIRTEGRNRWLAALRESLAAQRTAADA